jgi:hypothetical protein
MGIDSNEEIVAICFELAGVYTRRDTPAEAEDAVNAGIQHAKQTASARGDNRVLQAGGNKHSTDVESAPPPPRLPLHVRMCKSFHNLGESCSHLGRVHVLNDPAARTLTAQRVPR